MKSAFRIVLVVGLALIAQQMLLGSSIITMPTADVAGPRVVNVATYAVNFDGSPNGVDTTMNVYIVYASLLKNLEIEANVYDYNNSGFKQDFFVVTYKAASETKTRPQIAIGVKNPTGEILGNDDNPFDDNPSYFIATVKTLAAPKPGGPFSPVVRLHVGLGTNYHKGIFGGLQAMLTPQFGVAVINDTNDTLVSAAFKADPNAPTLKAGKLGKHSWIGIDYDIRF